MQKVAVIVPPLGHRYVDKTERKRMWGRRLYHHGGSVGMTFPFEIRRQLRWESGDLLILEVVGDEVRIHKPAVRELEESQVQK